MKFFSLFLILISGLSASVAKADVDCMGVTQRDQTQVTVHITNNGKIGATQNGFVRILSANGNSEDYLISIDDISQFFEGARGSNQVMVGLEAYTNVNDPISINYVGTNYDTTPLITSFQAIGRQKEVGNSMIVWKGSGFKSTEQYYFEDVVCSVVLAP